MTPGEENIYFSTMCRTNLNMVSLDFKFFFSIKLSRPPNYELKLKIRFLILLKNIDKPKTMHYNQINFMQHEQSFYKRESFLETMRDNIVIPQLSFE